MAANIDTTILIGLCTLIGGLLGAVVTSITQVIINKKPADSGVYERLFTNLQTEINRLQANNVTREERLIKLELATEEAKKHERECIQKLEIVQNQISEIQLRAKPAFVSANEKQLITRWDEQAEKIFGWKASEAIGQNISLIISPENVNKHDHGFKKALTMEEYPNVVTRASEAITKDGTRISVSISITRRNVFEGKGYIFTAEIYKR